MLFGRKKLKALSESLAEQSESQSYWSIVRKQFRKNKMALWSLRILYILFFIALFSQFAVLDNQLGSKVLIVATPFLVDGLWYTFIAFVVSSDKWLASLRTQAVIIDRLSGIILIALAIRVFTMA